MSTTIARFHCSWAYVRHEAATPWSGSVLIVSTGSGHYAGEFPTTKQTETVVDAKVKTHKCATQRTYRVTRVWDSSTLKRSLRSLRNESTATVLLA